MSNHTSVLDVARAAGVSKTTVSFVLSGKGDEERIAHETQERIRAVARQLNYQHEFPVGNPVPQASATVPDGTRKIGMIVAVSSPATTLGLAPGQERVLDSKGFTVTLVAVTSEPADTQERIGRLLRQGVAGILCCPSVFSAVAVIASRRCPVVAMSPWAADSLVNKIQNPGSGGQAAEGIPAATIKPQPVGPISPVPLPAAPVPVPVRPAPASPVAPSQQEPAIQAPPPAVVPVVAAVTPPVATPPPHIFEPEPAMGEGAPDPVVIVEPEATPAPDPAAGLPTETVTPLPEESTPVIVEVAEEPPVEAPVVETPIPTVEPVPVDTPVVTPPPESAPAPEPTVQPEVVVEPAPPPEPVPEVTSAPAPEPLPVAVPPPEPVPEPIPVPPSEPVAPPPEDVAPPPVSESPGPETVSGEPMPIGNPETAETAEGEEIKVGG